MNSQLRALLFILAISNSANAAYDPTTCEDVFTFDQGRSIWNMAYGRMKSEGFLKYSIRLRDQVRDQLVPKFINTAVRGSADLQRPFIAAFDPADREVYDETQAQVSSDRHPTYYTYRGRDDLIGTEVEPEVVYDRLVNERDGRLNEANVQTHISGLVLGIKDALRRLALSFAHQGPERQALFEVVREQDSDPQEMMLVTHFLAMNHSSPIAHLQILVSTDPNVPLHIDKDKELRAQIAPIPGQRRGEVGRFFIYRFSDKDENVLPTYNWRNWKELEKEAPIVRLELIHQAFAWAGEDADLDTLSFQINTGVYNRLMELGVPLEAARHDTVFKTVNGVRIPEHILVFDRAGIAHVQDVLMRKMLAMKLQEFLAKPASDAAKLILRFSRNQFRSLVASGLFGADSTALNNSLASGASEPPVRSFARVLSADFEHSEMDRGIFTEHVVSRKEDLGKPFKPVSSLLSARPDFANGIFHWPWDRYQTPRAYSVIELHLSRNAAEHALALINSNP